MDSGLECNHLTEDPSADRGHTDNKSNCICIMQYHKSKTAFTSWREHFWQLPEEATVTADSEAH